MNRSSLVPFAAVCLSILAALPAAAQEATMQQQPLVPVLTVSADGESRVAPDEATVRLGVFAQAPTAREAQNQVNRTAGAILEAVRKLGIPADRIQTSELNLGPVYGQGRPDNEPQEPRIIGYQSSNVVSIQVEQLDKVGPVIDAGLGAGANRLDGVMFGLRDDRKARAEALTNAVDEARTKADALARALKVRLVRILEVAEGGVAVMPQPMVRGRMAMESAAMADTPVAAGQVGVSANVTVRWEIAPE
jgi:uncharacterized protein YggE